MWYRTEQLVDEKDYQKPKGMVDVKIGKDSNDFLNQLSFYNGANKFIWMCFEVININNLSVSMFDWNRKC